MNIHKVTIKPEDISPEQKIKIDITQSNNSGSTYKVTAQAMHNGVTCEVIFNKCILLEDGSFEALVDDDGNKYTMTKIGAEE